MKFVPTTVSVLPNGAHQALDGAAFRAFFDQSPFYAGILGIDGTLLDASRVSLDRAGYAREDVLGRKFWDAGWWHGSKASQERVRAGFEGAALFAWNCRCRLLRHD